MQEGTDPAEARASEPLGPAADLHIMHHEPPKPYDPRLEPGSVCHHPGDTASQPMHRNSPGQDTSAAAAAAVAAVDHARRATAMPEGQNGGRAISRRMRLPDQASSHAADLQSSKQGALSPIQQGPSSAAQAAGAAMLQTVMEQVQSMVTLAEAGAAEDASAAFAFHCLESIKLLAQQAAAGQTPPRTAQKHCHHVPHRRQKHRSNTLVAGASHICHSEDSMLACRWFTK